MSKFDDAISIMNERFGHDCLISVATLDGVRPSVRTVDAYFDNGAFYVVTNLDSNKMKQIGQNPEIAICGDWFTAHAIGENLGCALDDSNAEYLAKARIMFAGWFGEGGHVDDKSPDNCILRISLTDGVLIDNETKYGVWRYEIDFANCTA